jgi:hypothetical protein
MMQAMSPGRPRTSTRALAVAAMLLALGTVVAYVGLLNALIPLRPLWYLGALSVATLLAVVAVRRTRHWLTVSALGVSVLLLGTASFFHFVAMRVPPGGPPAFVVGQPAPEFTLPDAGGRPVHLAEYRGQRPVLLVFYRGYW